MPSKRAGSPDTGDGLINAPVALMPAPSISPQRNRRPPACSLLTACRWMPASRLPKSASRS